MVQIDRKYLFGTFYDRRRYSLSKIFKKNFHKKAKDLYNKICEHGNPFAIDHESLLKLDTQEIFDPTVEQTIRNLESKGTEQYNQFVSERLETGNKSIHDVLPKNSNPLMSTPLKKLGSSTSAGNKLKAMKLNSTVFSQLVALLQSRPVSLQKLFSFELHFFPPAISNE